MTDIWSIGITVRICDCRSQDEGSTPSWTAKYLIDGPLVEWLQRRTVDACSMGSNPIWTAYIINKYRCISVGRFRHLGC